MSSQWTDDTIRDTFKKVMDQASTDAAFRQLALSHPAEAVERVAGMALPAGVKIQFVDNAESNFTVVLPDMRKADATELSDAELEQVAGGRGSSCRSGGCNPMALSVTTAGQ